MYYVLVILILILYNEFNNRKLSYNNERRGNLFCYLICAILVLLAAFRSDNVGTDTLGYRLSYEFLSRYDSIPSLINRYTINYLGYYGLSRFFYLMNMPVQVWFGFVEAIYLYALMLLVNRFSKDKIFSLLVFVTIGLYTFSMAGLKQTLAASFIYFSFILFIDKKYLLCFVFLILTYYTHQAALIFLFAFPCYLLRNSKYLVAVCFISCVLIYFYSTFFIGAMLDTLGNEHFRAYDTDKSNYSYVTFIFYATLTLLCYLNYRDYKNDCPGDSRFIMGMSLLTCGLQLLAGVSPSLFRLANMYAPFMMALLPNTTYYVARGKRQDLKLILMGCIIFYFFYAGRNSSYTFI